MGRLLRMHSCLKSTCFPSSTKRSCGTASRRGDRFRPRWTSSTAGQPQKLVTLANRERLPRSACMCIFAPGALSGAPFRGVSRGGLLVR
jgi:hypothetical protein